MNISPLVIALSIGSGASAAFCQSPSSHSGVRPEIAAKILEMKAGTETGSAEVPWRLYVPENIKKGEKLPLVVGLHGAGSRGADNVKPMSLFKSFWSPEIQKNHRAFVLVPQMRHGWVLQPGGFINYDADKVPASRELETMLGLVEKTVAENPIDPDRIYLVGTSMGGYGVWDALIRRPDLWAAAVPICGGGDPNKAESFKAVPIWAWHGNEDTVVPIANTRAMIEALEKVGAKPKYSEVQRAHDSWVSAFADAELYDWMFDQKRPASR